MSWFTWILGHDEPVDMWTIAIKYDDAAQDVVENKWLPDEPRAFFAMAAEFVPIRKDRVPRSIVFSRISASPPR